MGSCPMQAAAQKGVRPSCSLAALISSAACSARSATASTFPMQHAWKNGVRALQRQIENRQQDPQLRAAGGRALPALAAAVALGHAERRVGALTGAEL